MNEIIVPIIIGLCEILKRLGIASKWIPVFAVMFGVAVTTVTEITFLEGVMYGLSAVGLYSGTRAVVR